MSDVPFDDGNCFACGPENPIGMHVHFDRASDAEGVRADVDARSGVSRLAWNRARRHRDGVARRSDGARRRIRRPSRRHGGGHRALSQSPCRSKRRSWCAGESRGSAATCSASTRASSTKPVTFSRTPRAASFLAGASTPRTTGETRERSRSSNDEDLSGDRQSARAPRVPHPRIARGGVGLDRDGGEVGSRRRRRA